MGKGMFNIARKKPEIKPVNHWKHYTKSDLRFIRKNILMTDEEIGLVLGKKARSVYMKRRDMGLLMFTPPHVPRQEDKTRFYQATYSVGMSGE